MGRYFRLFLISMLVLIGSCKKKTDSSLDTDNLFKFKDYISYHTNGTQSISTPIKVVLAKQLDQFELTQELPSEYFKISPKIEGKLVIENGRELVFQPSEYLEPNTEYAVSVALNKLFDAIDRDFKEYTFSFKTITPNFKINLGNLQSYSKNWQYLTGTLEASDILNASKINSVLSVAQGDKKISVKWENTKEDARYFTFKIDSIPRKTDDSELAISWNGEALGTENKGSENYTIPGLNKFIVVDAKTSTAPNAALTLNFSDPLKQNQNLNGLVTIEGAQSLRYEINGNVLQVYPANRILGQVRVNVFEGIKSEYGYSLKKPFSELVSFEQLKPSVRLISKGTILPNAASTPIYFETVNLSAVEVRVIQVFENNMLQYLQHNDLTQRYNSDIRTVGRRVAYKVIPLVENKDDDTSSWKAHALDLSKLIKVNPGSLYRIEFSFKKEHTTYGCEGSGNSEGDEATNSIAEAQNLSEEAREERYWDNELYYWRDNSYNWEERDNPCHNAFYNSDRIAFTNLLGSDLGLIVKKGNNRSYHFAATNLVTTNPEAGATIKLYNYQQQLLSEVKTDASGFGIYDGDANVAFAIAEKNNNFAYAKLADGNALSLSKFDVSGQKLQSGLQGFMYTERGVHRPGDPIHLTFVLDDKANPLPAKHPVSMEVTDARGKLVQRNVLKEGTIPVADGLYAKKEGNFYYFPIPTKSTSPTGTWNAKVIVGGAQFNKSLKVATIKPNRLKVSFDFEDEVLKANRNNKGKAEVKWLHGAPARNLKIDINAKLQQASNAFPKHKGYIFQDPVRTFNDTELQFVNSKLNGEGVLNIDQKITANTNAPGMLQATFTTKVFEGGGDFSIDVFSKKLAPFSHFVGLRSPKAKRYGSFLTDEDTTFDVISVDADGKKAANRKLKVKIFEIAWRWWWNRGYDNLSRYENATVHKPFKEMTVTTGADGKANFKVNIPDDDGGRYLVRVIDEVSGHATGRTAYFYRNWWRRPASGDTESSKILIFSADKEKYTLGDQAVVTFPSDVGGRALLSIENGSEVLSQKWIETSAKETKATIPITADMAPNAYINISLLQPHGQVANDLPIRLYGIVPLLVENPATFLKPELEMPEVLAPEKSYKVTVSESNKKPMTYSLAVVDEGLLDLTRFKTPDIHSSFYARQALGVKTFDIFDDVMGAYSISVDNIYAIGGGGIGEGAKNRKAQRFKPVVTYLGPFTLKAGEKTTHTIDMPNYVGSVRTMVVAGNKNSAYGKAEKATPVRKPLMVLTSIPRKLSPGETVTIPVTVFAMEKKVKNVKVSIDAGKALEPIGATTKNITFNSVGEQIVNFDFKVNPSKSFQTIKVTVSGNGERASNETEIDVENPNPITTKSTLYTVTENQSQSISFETFGTSGTNTAFIEFSTLPPMDFSKRMNYLLQYPHGCVEQTTSAAFPQLFLTEILDITFDRKKEIEKNIKAAIKKLNDFQAPSGGLSYWPGYGYADDWGTSYAGHFMLEAKQKGYQLPLTFLSNWLRYQKNTARQWSNQRTSYNTDIAQAYRLYTLALAQQPELAAMNRLREAKNLSNEAKWRLAAAYALVGKKEVAQQLIQKANINFQPNSYNYRTYGSVFRNMAMALETMVIIGDDQQRELAISLAKKLSSQSWYSTQETSFALLAMAKMVAKNGGKSINLTFTNNGKEITVKTDRAIAQRGLSITSSQSEITVNNKQGNVIYATLTQTGKLPVGEELAQQRNLSLSVRYLDAVGNSIDVSNLRQGTELQAQLTVFNSSNDYIDNLALTQIVPSGWEIVNTSYAGGGDSNSSKAEYIDTRDDRTNFYFDLGSKKSKTFTVKLNASFLGDYYLPGSQVEAMYDDNRYARNKGQWIKVSQ
ncbi:MG2 domain-containing protein [Flagellimonas sp. HMM57]|uniref:alpha-2-macroglobulin family protein n=1 Tax=unclassified Flagellimonas TaxID=2644544 RepID=UPI0013D195BE|nr:MULTISPECIES: MG2 domain-containing protein [unclassified Flagellimonas]UII74801.1 MG2 domain-containing protein [Flagellimonas sp. HMM57]